MKKKLLALLTGIALVLALAACGGGGDEEATDTGTDDAAETETTEEATDETTDTAGVDVDTVYAQSCAACHANDLTGGVGPDLTKVGASLSKDEIKDIIVNGQGSMPAQNVSDEEAEALAEWLAAKQ